MITRIWQQLAVGSIDDARKLANANPLGIRTVISLCGEEVFPRAGGIRYMHLPVDDSHAICGKLFDQIMSVIGTSVRRGGVLLHCVGGMSRSPIICAAFLQRCGYATVDAALAEIADLRPTIDPSPVLLTSVRRLLQ